MLARMLVAVIDAFRIRDPNLKEAVVYVGKACAPGAAGVDVRDVRADVPAGVPVVQDAR